MPKFTYIPRAVYFKTGQCIGTGFSASGLEVKVIHLPTEHYDFPGPIERDIKGKTYSEILAEVEQFKKDN
jgi:hypothetical protein